MSVGSIALGGIELLSGLGVFGGGPQPCEEYAASAMRAIQGVSTDQARRAWQAIGTSTAEEILAFPALGTFCSTDNMPVACSENDFQEERWRQAGGFRLRDHAATALRAAGVPTRDGCTKEHIELAKPLLRKGRPPPTTQANVASGGGGVGGIGLTVGVLVLVVLIALAFWIGTRR